MDIDIAVVPVAGLGTRLLPATKSQPKEMLPVGRKPVVQYVVEELTRVGMRRLLFVTGPGKASIENHFDLNGELIRPCARPARKTCSRSSSSSAPRLQYFYTRQRRQLGLGHAVACAQPFVGDQPFVVALGDSIIGMHAESDVVRRMIQCYREQDAAAVIAFEEVPPGDVSHYGIAQPKTDGDLFEIVDLVEKPAPREAPSNLAIAARYVLSPAIFDALARTRRGKGGEIQLTDAIRRSFGTAARYSACACAPASAATTSATSRATSGRSWSSRWPTRDTARRCRRHLLDVLDVSHP